jgi:hypothetical protein
MGSPPNPSVLSSLFLSEEESNKTIEQQRAVVMEQTGNHLISLTRPAGTEKDEGFFLELGTNQEALFSLLKPKNNSFLRPRIEGSDGDEPWFLKTIFCRGEISRSSHLCE